MWLLSFASLSIHEFRQCQCQSVSEKKCTESKLVFVIQGFIAHSHDPELRFDRISSLTKQETLVKLEQEVPVTKIVTQSFNALLQDSVSQVTAGTDNQEHSVFDPDIGKIKKKPLTYGDVWRLKNQRDFSQFGLNEKDEVGNLFKLLEQKSSLATISTPSLIRVPIRT